MMLCITRVKPVPWVLKPMAMSLRRAREWLIGRRSSSHSACRHIRACRVAQAGLARFGEQTPAPRRAGWPPVAGVGGSAGGGPGGGKKNPGPLGRAVCPFGGAMGEGNPRIFNPPDQHMDGNLGGFPQ